MLGVPPQAPDSKSIRTVQVAASGPEQMRQVVEARVLHRGWGEWVDVGKGRKTMTHARRSAAAGGMAS